MKRKIPPERYALLGAGSFDGIAESEVRALRERFGNNVIAEYHARSPRQLAGDTARVSVAISNGVQMISLSLLLLASAPVTDPSKEESRLSSMRSRRRTQGGRTH